MTEKTDIQIEKIVGLTFFLTEEEKTEILTKKGEKRMWREKTRKDIEESMEEFRNALNRGGENDIKTAEEVAQFLLSKTELLSGDEKLELSKLIRKMKEKIKNK